MSTYSEIKGQIKYETGKQEIICPACQKNAIAKVSGKSKKWGTFPHRRHVVTVCRHCHTSYDFVW